jgi:predicted enzyme related to lactoylglutathione lyase
VAHPVTHFEIHGQDKQRLYAFYELVSGWSIDGSKLIGWGMNRDER